MTRTEQPHRAADLLADYQPGDAFFFSSPRQVLLAEGAAVVVPERPADLPGYVSTLLDTVRDSVREPIVVGAVPFEGASGAHLVVPASVRQADSAGLYGLPNTPASLPGHQVRPVPEPDDYVRGVERALALLRDGALEKVVLARSLHVTTAVPVDLRPVLRGLARRDPRGYTYAADLPGGRTLVGASPELLVSRIGDRVVANPLAGSLPRDPDPVEDGRRAMALRASDKDGREHAVVVEAVVEALRPYLKGIEVPDTPAVVPTAAMWHLSSRVTGEIADRSLSALDLAAALHPTPAVCGAPVDAAQAAIAALEPFHRGFYAGMVGWVDAEGDGEWVVGIRCAEADERLLRLFAGAGIMADSTPAAELAETTAKFQTLLSAMGMAVEV